MRRGCTVRRAAWESADDNLRWISMIWYHNGEP
jgi:hypothetical protein